MGSNNIAYIYMCHNNPEILGRVASILKYKDDAFFVHVDKRVDIKPFVSECSNKENVFFVENRIKNYWGGFNAVKATVETFRYALQHGDFSRFVILQGQDYPLYSPKEIHDFFDNNNKEYCKAKNVSVSKNKDDYMACSGYWYKDFDRDNKLLHAYNGIFTRINKLGIKYRKPSYKNKDISWDIYKGWAQLSLTRKCVEYILNIYDTKYKFNKYMSHCFPGDETYFHTIIHNSNFSNNIANEIIKSRQNTKTNLNCTYFEYPNEVTVYTDKQDYKWLKETGCLFVRKVNETSIDLLDEIDRNINV